MGTVKRIRLTIDSHLDNITLIGAAINNICATIPLSEVDIYQTELCIVEAVTNCIKHAYHNADDQEVSVELFIHDDHLVFEVIDTGTPMPAGSGSKSLAYDPRELEDVPEGGMGIFLMHEIMDEVAYRSEIDGRNVLRMVKRLGKTGENIRTSQTP